MVPGIERARRIGIRHKRTDMDNKTIGSLFSLEVNDVIGEKFFYSLPWIRMHHTGWIRIRFPLKKDQKHWVVT
jgi:hypothetical protein